MSEALKSLINQSLQDIKGKDIECIDVRELSDVMDFLIIVTGTSNRHVKSMANNLIEDAKESSIRPIGVEGMDGGEWVLVDYGDVVVHLMQQSAREFYELEKLWSTEPSTRKQKADNQVEGGN